MMNNYTYVPPDKTGFETPSEDFRQRAAKFESVEFFPFIQQIFYNSVLNSECLNRHLIVFGKM